MLDELYIAYSTVVVGGLFWKKKCALIIGIGYLAMHCSSSEWYVMLMCFGQYLSGPGLPQAEAVSYCHLAEPSEMRVVCWRAERAFLSLFELKQQRKLLYAITREHVIRHHWHAMSIGTPTFYWQLCTQRAVYELQGYEAMSSVQWCRRREERIVCYVWKMTQAFWVCMQTHTKACNCFSFIPVYLFKFLHWYDDFA